MKSFLLFVTILVFPGCLLFTGFLSTRCGDGVLDVDAGEVCDDNNNLDGDGCDSNCTITACENGIQSPNEFCIFLTQEITNINDPTNFAFGDIDNDFFPELVVSQDDFGNDNALLFQNEKDGTFSFQENLDSGDEPSDVLFADLNQDQFLDLVFLRAQDDRVGVLLNEKNRSFGDRQNFEISNDDKTNTIAIGDLDGDLLPDLVTGHSSESEIHILFNDDNELFENGFDTIPGFGADKILLGDIDNDGDLDVVTLGDDQQSILIFLNENGFLQVLNIIDNLIFFLQKQNDIALGDIDEDGFLDIVTAENNVLNIFKNNNGEFDNTPIQIENPDNPFAIALADIDQNGTLDILSANQQTQSISILINEGNGDISLSFSLELNNNPDEIRVEDFDQDGFLDIATLSQNDKVLSIFQNKP